MPNFDMHGWPMSNWSEKPVILRRLLYVICVGNSLRLLYKMGRVCPFHVRCCYPQNPELNNMDNFSKADKYL